MIDQSGLRGAIRDRPISKELEAVLLRAGLAAGIDRILVKSGGQPGTTGRSTGSTRHNGGRAADLSLIAEGRTLTFSDADADDKIKRFVTAAAARGASGIGAGVAYMGPDTLHIGFGLTVTDTSRLVWGAKGRSANAPKWLKDAAELGWTNPPSWVSAADEHVREDLPEEEDDVLDTPEDVAAITDIPKRFNLEVIRAAQDTQRRWGIPASVTLAQWAVESGYGAHMPIGSNNPFGIKALPGQPHVMAWTTEYKNGRKVTVNAAFRVFANLSEAFIAHGKLIGSAKAYARARTFAKQPDRFADALTNVYATDPGYGTMLKSIMRTNDLYRFDLDVDGETTPELTDWEADVTRPLQQGDVDAIRVVALQQRLVALGYKLGEIDGKFGPLTTTALLAFQNENGLPTTGVFDETTAEAMAVAQPRRLDPKRTGATEAQIANDGSRITVDAVRSRELSWITSLFGALGIGNSAIVNASGGTAAPVASALPDTLLPFLAAIQKLGPTTAPDEFARLAGIAAKLSQQLSGLSLPPESLQMLRQFVQSIPADQVANNPQLAAIVQTIGQLNPHSPAAMRTVFDILPSFFANDSVLQTVMQGVAGVGASVLPGFGGSLAVLGIGLVGRLLANRIAAARLEDHKTGGNINPLRKNSL